MKEEKLEYINNSICDIYVNYGMLEIDYVIDSIKKLDESKNNTNDLNNILIQENIIQTKNLTKTWERNYDQHKQITIPNPKYKCKIQNPNSTIHNSILRI